MLIQRRQIAVPLLTLMLAFAPPAVAAPGVEREPSLAVMASSALALEQAIAQRGGMRGNAASFNVYLRTQPNDLRLHSLRAEWGDASSLQVDLNHQTSEALRVGGIYALPLPVIRGATPQPLRVELIASRMVSGARISRLRLSFTGTIAPGADDRHVEVVLEQKGMRNRYDLAAAQVPSSERSLRVGVADLLLRTGHAYRAAAELVALGGAQAGAADMDLSRLLLRSRQALGIDDAAQTQGGSPASPVAARYASAHELLSVGRRDEAWAALKAVAGDADHAPASRVLRDRANLALAERALYDGRGRDAVAHFQQVHSPGPYASRALLGLGWSYLLSGSAAGATSDLGQTDGLAAVPRLLMASTLRPASADEAAELRRLSPFRYAQATSAGPRQDNLQQALSVWQELIGRDPADPAVQEGMLAMAYAFDHLGAHEQAMQRYQRALDQLLTTRGHLDAAIQHVESGALTAAMSTTAASAVGDWSWWLLERREARWWMDERVDAAPLFYVEHLLEQDPFRNVLGDYQSLQTIAGRLDQMAAQPLPGLDERVASLRQSVGAGLRRYQQQIEALAIADLQQRRSLVETYLAEAHLALARIYDKPPSVPNLYTPERTP